MLMSAHDKISLPGTKSIKIPNQSMNQMHHDIIYQYQCDLKPEMSDPFGSSPPKRFIMKLKERIGAYSSVSMGLVQPLYKNDLMRHSE